MKTLIWIWTWALVLGGFGCGGSPFTVAEMAQSDEIVSPDAGPAVAVEEPVTVATPEASTVATVAPEVDAGAPVEASSDAVAADDAGSDAGSDAGPLVLPTEGDAGPLSGCVTSIEGANNMCPGPSPKSLFCLYRPGNITGCVYQGAYTAAGTRLDVWCCAADAGGP
jgi:hypothetical protein